jgi:hypothetical protein
MTITNETVFKVCEENEITLTTNEMNEVVKMYYEGNHHNRNEYYDEIILELVENLNKTL